MALNHWTDLSIQFANQRNYLDELYKVYPTTPEGLRKIDKRRWQQIEDAFKKDDRLRLLSNLLGLDLFPIKDSYVAYLRRDSSALNRNPATVSRLYGRLREMGLKELYQRCSEPKETNRQIGPLFRRWLRKKTLGVELLTLDAFSSSQENAILEGSDAESREFARKRLGYTGQKGLDFVGRFNRKYVTGEAKFLTDFGGHQNAQYEDAKVLLRSSTAAVKVAILDGVLYIKGNNKMHRFLIEHPEQYNIMSALVFREFLYQV